MDEYEEIEMDTITYLKDVCNHLFHEKEPPDEKNEIAENLDIVTEDLSYMRQEYKLPAPRGAEGARNVMLDILSLFDKGVEGMLQYFEDEDREHLKESLVDFVEAENMLDSLRMAIDQHRLELAELLSKLESGEIREGEKIDEDSDTHVSITDEEATDLIVPEDELPRAPATKILDYDELNLPDQDEV